MTTDWTAGRPSFMGPAEEFRSPQEEWQAFMATQAPFWETRAPLQDVGARLRARYLLGAPQMAQTANTPVSFSQYLRGYQGMQPTGPDPDTGAMTEGITPGYYADQSQLLERAQQARAASMMDPGAYVAQFTPETSGFDQAAWMAEQFNPIANAQRAQQNQLAVANMLALQRPESIGGGQTTGMMASAVRNAMARLQQQRLNTGAAQGSFLDWYLGQTNPAG
jgi:hypothetical protein